MLLSRIFGDPTVGGLRAEKEKRSMRSRLRMDSGFVSFRQTPRGRGFSLLEFFIYSLSVFQCFGWHEVLNGRLIGPKLWDQIDRNFWKPKC